MWWLHLPLKWACLSLVLNAFGIGLWPPVSKPKISYINKYYSRNSILSYGWLDNKDACIQTHKCRFITCRPRAVTTNNGSCLQVLNVEGRTVGNRIQSCNWWAPKLSVKWKLTMLTDRTILCRFSSGPHHDIPRSRWQLNWLSQFPILCWTHYLFFFMGWMQCQAYDERISTCCHVGHHVDFSSI